MKFFLNCDFIITYYPLSPKCLDGTIWRPQLGKLSAKNVDVHRTIYLCLEKGGPELSLLSAHCALNWAKD